MNWSLILLFIFFISTMRRTSLIIYLVSWLIFCLILTFSLLYSNKIFPIDWFLFWWLECINGQSFSINYNNLTIIIHILMPFTYFASVFISIEYIYLDYLKIIYHWITVNLKVVITLWKPKKMSQYWTNFICIIKTNFSFNSSVLPKSALSVLRLSHCHTQTREIL